ncbi:MAG: hypothetical protein NTV38_12195 [Chloroflexi bacterium]|nr:hypothetical protein [Chloroflexota bacterium]
MMAVIGEKAEQLENYGVPQVRRGSDYFLLRTVQLFPSTSVKGSGFAR